MLKEERVVDILLVEDNPGDVELTQEAFEGSKFRKKLHVARDGDEALDFFYKRGDFVDAVTPDIVLLDLNLPKTDGREVLTIMKADEAFKDLPVIILTSSHMDRDVLEKFDLPSNCYIVKPIDLSQFLKALKHLDGIWLDVIQSFERK